MMERSRDGSAIKDKGWRQGSILPPALFRQVASELDLDESSVAVLVTHSCDLVHHDFHKEPHAEVIVGRPCDRLDHSRTPGKNPRVIQIELIHDGGRHAFEFSVHDRLRFDRTHLAAHSPSRDWHIEAGPLDDLTEWLARRYTRSAFPDEFNRRLAAARSFIKKGKRLFERQGEGVWAIFMRLDTPNELSEDSSYRVIVRIVTSTRLVSEPSERMRLEDVLLEPFVELLGQVPGIEVVDYDLVDMNEFSVAEATTMIRFENWDYLSNEADGFGS
jgi:hypothetical protein